MLCLVTGVTAECCQRQERRHAPGDRAFHYRPWSHSCKPKARKTAEGKLLSTTRILLLFEPLPSWVCWGFFIYESAKRRLCQYLRGLPLPCRKAQGWRVGRKTDGSWIVSNLWGSLIPAAVCLREMTPVLQEQRLIWAGRRRTKQIIYCRNLIWCLLVRAPGWMAFVKTALQHVFFPFSLLFCKLRSVRCAAEAIPGLLQRESWKLSQRCNGTCVHRDKVDSSCSVLLLITLNPLFLTMISPGCCPFQCRGAAWDSSCTHRFGPEWLCSSAASLLKGQSSACWGSSPYDQGRAHPSLKKKSTNSQIGKLAGLRQPANMAVDLQVSHTNLCRAQPVLSLPYFIKSVAHCKQNPYPIQEVQPWLERYLALSTIPLLYGAS